MRYVLIADAHEIARRGLRDVLRDQFTGVEVSEAEDGRALSTLLPRRAWDLVMLDMLVPGGSLLEHLRAIRAVHPTAPVLVLTAATELEYVPLALKGGANGLIHKHRPAEDLIRAMDTVVNGGQYLHPETAALLATTGRDDAALPHARLSGREFEIFRLIALGKTVKEIAGSLGLSDKTVATYLARIREKTGLSSHVKIARYALQHRLVD